MPENFLVPSQGTPQVDVFMSRKILRSDWGQITRDVEAGKITVDGVLAELQALEPVPRYPSFDLAHRIWVLQEKLRMALRREKGGKKTDLTKVPCGCGRAGHFHLKAFYQNCVACEEVSAQLDRMRGRGNCWYLLPSFDVASRTWGMLSYDGNDRDSTILFFAAVGWSSYDEALEEGMLPWASYWKWMWMHYPDGMPFHAQFFPWDKIVKLNPPLSPQEWRAFTREQLTELIAHEGTSWV